MWKYFIFPRKIDTHLYPLHNTEEKVMSIWQKKLALKNWKNLPFLISAFAKQYWYSNSSHFSLVLHKRGNLIYDLNVTKCHRNVNSNSTFLLRKIYSYITKVKKKFSNSIFFHFLGYSTIWKYNIWCSIPRTGRRASWKHTLHPYFRRKFPISSQSSGHPQPLPIETPGGGQTAPQL